MEKECKICNKKFKTYSKEVICCSKYCSKKNRQSKTSWNKGKKSSRKTRKKISEAMHKQYEDGTRGKNIINKAHEKLAEKNWNRGVPKYNMRGKNNPSWKGGRYLRKDGYISIAKFGTRILEHRYVWETANGEIPEGFQIHHKDGDKTNNKLSNLQLLSNSDHQKLHPQPRDTSTGKFTER